MESGPNPQPHCWSGCLEPGREVQGQKNSGGVPPPRSIIGKPRRKLALDGDNPQFVFGEHTVARGLGKGGDSQQSGTE